MLDVHIKVDHREFDRVFAEYLKLSKKDLRDIVNKKAYFIARNAVMLTPIVDKDKITRELMASSNLYPKAPLAAIIANKQYNRIRVSKKTGKRLTDKAALYGDKMKQAITKLINKRKRSVNYLRSGWIAAIKAIEPFQKTKSGPYYKRGNTFGKPMGGAKGALDGGLWTCVASIWNSVINMQHKDNIAHKGSTQKIQQILTIGMQKAINKETASMRGEVEKRLQARADKVNRS